MQGRGVEGSQTRGRLHKRGTRQATNVLKSSHTRPSGCAVSMASFKGMWAKDHCVTFWMVCTNKFWRPFAKWQCRIRCARSWLARLFIHRDDAAPHPEQKYDSQWLMKRLIASEPQFTHIALILLFLLPLAGRLHVLTSCTNGTVFLNHERSALLGRRCPL